MLSNKLKEEFCWSKSQVLFLPIFVKYLSENFYERANSYYIKDGSFVNRMVKGYGLSDIDVNNLVGELSVWFCSALQEYTFEEVITENFTVKRDSYVYNKLRSELHNYLKYLKVRYKPIPENKRHFAEEYKLDYVIMPKQEFELNLSVLNPDEKLVIDYISEKLTIKKIAQKLGKSESTIKRLKSQARQKLLSSNKPSE